MSYEYRPLNQETLRRIIRTRAITVNGRVQISLDPEARWVIIQNAVRCRGIHRGQHSRQHERL
jgi:hypothetical protein